MKKVPRFVYTQALVESAIMIAAAQLLSYIKIFEAPYGGSVTVASMLPIIIVAIRRGPGWGFGAGLAYGLLQQFLGGTFYSIPSMFLDYLVAFTLLGVASFFRNTKYGIVWGSIAAGLARFASHYVSGILLWGAYAEDMPAWLYSLAYNGSYMGIEIVLCAVLGFALLKAKADLVRPVIH